MFNRRHFLQWSLSSAAIAALSESTSAASTVKQNTMRVVSTWNFGVGANQAAWHALKKGGNALDAVENGARWAESELCNPTVGHCGNPDRDGILTLDASIMDGDGRCGSVAALEDILHPVSVARQVMEKTPHVMLVGDGAQKFALQNGFQKQDLLTDSARSAWIEWQKKSEYKPAINAEKVLAKPGDKNNHDTLGILALDAQGKLAGACTTSGMAWKYHGRVGDSPIIGAGLYADNDVGAATASGVGEEMIRNAASFLVVEFMRQGRSPQEACRAALERIVSKRGEATKNLQVCLLALNKHGEVGAFALHAGFDYAICDHDGDKRLLNAASVFTDSK